ncbi:MAG: UDP-N-acetylmuramate--L-alanine ligase [Phycisphaerales bacterium]|nr:MAG: UDP-N-acetylmuramate--L-alanine ligase [Phycisphaerales bacterium]
MRTVLAPSAVKPVSQKSYRGLRVHMIGVGGAGMSGAAKMLVQLGATVSGSDLTCFSGLGALVSQGVRVTIGHDAGYLDSRTDLVVASAAVPESNPELQAAVRGDIRLIKYAELLGELMDFRDGVAIAGTHGKTTTTAMCAYLLQHAGLAPSFIFGAESDQLGGSSGVGSGRHFVVESCEFDRSFLHLRPCAAAILNVESDHLDCYGSLDAIAEAFGRFAANVDPGGLVVCNATDGLAVETARCASARVETFGIESDADWQAVNLRCERGLFIFDVVYQDCVALSTRLVIPGRYNVENALAATALAAFSGVEPRCIAEGLALFAGVGRRLAWRGLGRGVNIIDDYAHHPTEVRATIEAARSRYEPKRTWVVFQPHQYERTRCFLDEFARSFGQADEVIIPTVFGARESSSEDCVVGSELLASRIRDRGMPAHYVPTLDEAADYVAQRATDGDLVVTMGAGDVWKVADALVERLC